MRRDYYATVTHLDTQLGKVIAALDSCVPPYLVLQTSACPVFVHASVETCLHIPSHCRKCFDPAFGPHRFGPELGLETLLVFHGDHGFSLGEHGQWQKFTNFEHGTRVPLIVAAPWLSPSGSGRAAAGGAVSGEVVSLVDVFPTVASLVGVPAPESYGLEGKDLTAFLLAAAPLEARGDRNSTGGSSATARTAPATALTTGWSPPAAAEAGVALSEFPRCPPSGADGDPALWWQANDCLYVERVAFALMGLSLRTENTGEGRGATTAASAGESSSRRRWRRGRSTAGAGAASVPEGSWRYTEWLRWSGRHLAPYRNGTLGVELYNHTGDDGTSFDGPFEVANLAGDPHVADVQAAFAALLRDVYPTWV